MPIGASLARATTVTGAVTSMVACTDRHGASGGDGAARAWPSALATRNAASTPPSAPNRCACQDTVTTPVMSAAATVTMPVQNRLP